MRRLLGTVRINREGHDGAKHLSHREVRAIRHAIDDASTPGMRADLLAAANRQGVYIR